MTPVIIMIIPITTTISISVKPCLFLKEEIKDIDLEKENESRADNEKRRERKLTLHINRSPTKEQFRKKNQKKPARTSAAKIPFAINIKSSRLKLGKRVLINSETKVTPIKPKTRPSGIIL